jgi:hypothetical protein
MKCACMTVWQVDRGDEWIAVPANVAASLSGNGFSVRLVSVSTSPLRPVTGLAGIQYERAPYYVVKWCEVCGFPTRRKLVSRRDGR